MGRNLFTDVGGEDDDETFALFYRRHHRDVWKMSCFYLKDPHEAEDAAQETFLKAWRGRSRCRSAGSGRTWLLAICRNVCLDRLRRRPKGVALASLDEDDHVAVSDPRSDAEDHDRRMDLRRALAGLGAEEREAWFLVDVVGLSSDEVARVVGASAASTVRSRVARARRDLAAELHDELPAALNGALAADVRGLYHSSQSNAIVVSLAKTAAGSGRCTERPSSAAASRAERSALRQSYLRLYARLEAPVHNSPTAATAAASMDLFEFLERLDRDVPPDRRVLALVETPCTDSAERARRWGAAHPRWSLHGAHCHLAWQRGVEELFAGQANGEQNHGARRMLALIDAAQHFVWTDGQNGFHR